MLRGWVRACVALLVAGLAGAMAKADVEKETVWHDVRPLGVEGQGWKDVTAAYDRLPGKAEKLVRPAVWGLSRHSAGLCVRFVSDATTLDARWTLTSERLAMPHMPATGVSGLDLYVRGPSGRWRWLSVAKPTKAPTNTARLVTGLPEGKKREFLLYYPLYNGVKSVEVGVPKGKALGKAPERPVERRKPIVFYGTSITQGGCASRPGMVHTAILGRRLDWPVVNLGFSGNGRMELELARLLGEIDAAVYVIDCLPNMSAKSVESNAEPFVKVLRKARPRVPILLVEDRSYANASLLPDRGKRNAASRAALKKAYDRLVRAGVEGLHYLPGDKLLGADGEDTVDGSHPTDLGFLRQADAFQPVLAPLLPKAAPGGHREMRKERR